MLFKDSVYRIVTDIPKGRAVTYKQVAELAGHAGAWRAVGNILNQNRDPKIPCHRVIRSNGQIGGFNRGAKTKCLLLQKEGVRLR